MGRLFIGLVIALLANCLSPPRAVAGQVLTTSSAPILRIQMRRGLLKIQTWNKSQVSIDSSAPVRARVFHAQTTALTPPHELTIFSRRAATGLPEETFPLPTVTVAGRDAVVLVARDADVTVTVPASTALIYADVGQGRIILDGYRNGKFVALVGIGGLRLINVSGDGFVQTESGRIAALHSDFHNIRARTSIGNIVFEHCSASQIIVTSIAGNIVYDDGAFDSGIAHFESQYGNIAIGISRGGAVIDAHSSQSGIFSDIGGSVVRGSATDHRTVVGGGGPLVTANSRNGGVFLYSGSVRSSGLMQRRRRAIRRMLDATPPVLRRPQMRDHFPDDL